MAKKSNLIYSPPWDILTWPNSQSPFASSPCQTFRSLAPAFPTETLSSRCAPSAGRQAPLRSERSAVSRARPPRLRQLPTHGADPAPRSSTGNPGSAPETYLLFKVRPAQRHPLLQLLEFPFVLCFCLHLNFALVRVEQLHLLLELQSQGLAFRFLGLIQPQL